MKINFLLYIVLGSFLFLFINGCAPEGQKENLNSGKAHSLKIVATTGIIGDAVKNIVGNKAKVDVLMGPGVDPHLYKASQKDLEALSGADLIFYNGLALEGKIGEILEKLKTQKKTVVALAEAIPEKELIKTDEFGGQYDPHVWLNVKIWKYAVERCGKVLQAKDSANAQIYQKNLIRYLQELDSLDTFIETEIQKIPVIPRVLITAHDAFSYFGLRYKIEVKSLQGISTVAEFGLKDVADLVDFIVQRKIKSVFMESFIPERSIKAVIEGCKAKNHQVRLGGVLYSDALGKEGTPEGTYIGMMKANVKTITEGLK
jgi:manganese/zinc/iron transport system substrate-binding protein